MWYHYMYNYLLALPKPNHFPNSTKEENTSCKFTLVRSSGLKWFLQIVEMRLLLNYLYKDLDRILDLKKFIRKK